MIQIIRNWICILSEKLCEKVSSSINLSHQDSDDSSLPNNSVSPNYTPQKCYRCGGNGIILPNRRPSMNRYDAYSYGGPLLFEEQCYICGGTGYISKNE